MTYGVVFLPEAEEDLKRLDRAVGQRILAKISWLARNFESLVPERLSGSLRGLYKERVGSYRVLYSVNSEERLIAAHLIGHRRQIYK